MILADDPVDDPAGEADAPDGDGDRTDPEATPVADQGPRRWGRLAGVASLVYVVWYVTDLVLLERYPTTYSSLHRFYDGLGARAVLSVVFLALLFHAFDGLRVIAEDFRPALRRRDLWWRAVARFFTVALWVPGAVALVLPAVR